MQEADGLLFKTFSDDQKRGGMVKIILVKKLVLYYLLVFSLGTSLYGIDQKFNIVTCIPELNYFSIQGSEFGRYGTNEVPYVEKQINSPIDESLLSYMVYDGDSRVYQCKLKKTTLKFQITPSPLNKYKYVTMQEIKVWEKNRLFIHIESYNRADVRKERINRIKYWYFEDKKYGDHAYIDINSVPPSWSGIYEPVAYRYDFKSYIPSYSNFPDKKKNFISYELKEKWVEEINNELLAKMRLLAEEKRKDH